MAAFPASHHHRYRHMRKHALTQETEMLDHLLSNRTSAGHSGVVRTTLAAVCVAGIVAGLVVHYQPGVDDPRDPFLLSSMSVNQTGSQAAPGSSEYLRAPASDPSVPPSAGVFAKDAPGGEEIPIAQF